MRIMLLLVLAISLLACNEDSTGKKNEEKSEKKGGDPRGQTTALNHALSTVYLTGEEFKTVTRTAAKLSFQFGHSASSAKQLTLFCWRFQGNEYDTTSVQKLKVEKDKWPLALESSAEFVLGAQNLKQPNINRLLTALASVPGNDAEKIISFRPLMRQNNIHVTYGINIFPSLQAFRAAALKAPEPIEYLNPSPPAKD